MNIGYKNALWILFFEGFVSLSAEVISMRQISIFAGNTIEVTSVIIGFFLAALAAGYAKGGTATIEQVGKNFVTATVFLVVGCSLYFQGFLYSLVGDSKYVYIVVACMFTVVPIAYYLGQTLPALTEAMREDSVNKASSMVMFTSTIGSFLSAIVVPVVLMRYVGVSFTILVVAVMALGCAIFLNRSVSNVARVVFIAGLALILNYFVVKTLPVVSENAYATVAVTKKSDTSYFIINTNSSSALDSDGELVFKYAKRVRGIINEEAVFKDKSLSVLVLGAGGFTLSVDDDYNNYTFVDPNGDLKKAAETHFLKSPVVGDFVVEDALRYLRSYNGPLYDVIVVDVYKSGLNFPRHLMTVEFFELVSKGLTQDGVLLMNLIADKRIDQFRVDVDATLRRVFPSCSVNREVEASISNVNYVYTCYQWPQGSTTATLDKYLQ